MIQGLQWNGSVLARMFAICGGRYRLPSLSYNIRVDLAAQIALNFPLLWTEMDLSRLSNDASHAMLERAQAQALHVTTSRPSLGLDKMELVLRSGFPIEAMKFNLSTALEISLHWIQRNDSITRNLVSLEIIAPDCTTERGYDPEAPHVYALPYSEHLPRPALVRLSLSQCSFPALRELTLINCTTFLHEDVTHATAPFPQLERLVIDCHRVLGMAYPMPIARGQDRPSLPDLLALTPRLRALSLGRAFTPIFRAPGLGMPPMQLPPILERISLIVVKDLRNMHFLNAIRSLDLRHAPGLSLSLRIARVYRGAYRMRTLHTRDLVAYLAVRGIFAH